MFSPHALAAADQAKTGNQIWNKVRTGEYQMNLIADPVVCFNVPKVKMNKCMLSVVMKAKDNIDKLIKKQYRFDIFSDYFSILSTLTTHSDSYLGLIKDLEAFNLNLIILIDHSDRIEPAVLDHLVEKSGVVEFEKFYRKLDFGIPLTDQWKDYAMDIYSRIRYYSTYKKDKLKESLRKMSSYYIYNFIKDAIRENPFSKYSDGVFMFNLMRRSLHPDDVKLEILYAFTRIKLQTMARLGTLESPQIITLPDALFPSHYVNPKGVTFSEQEPFHNALDFYHDTDKLFPNGIFKISKVSKVFDTATIYDIKSVPSHQLMVIKVEEAQKEFDVEDEPALLHYLKGKMLFFSQDLFAFFITTDKTVVPRENMHTFDDFKDLR